MDYVPIQCDIVTRICCLTSPQSICSHQPVARGSSIRPQYKRARTYVSKHMHTSRKQPSSLTRPLSMTSDLQHYYSLDLGPSLHDKRHLLTLVDQIFILLHWDFSQKLDWWRTQLQCLLQCMPSGV